jgi:hypothetical protein
MTAPDVIHCRECGRPWGVRLGRPDGAAEAREALLDAYRTFLAEDYGTDEYAAPELPEPEQVDIVFVSAADNRWLDWVGIESCADSDTWNRADHLPEMPKWWNGFKRAKPALWWDCCQLDPVPLALASEGGDQ